MPDVETRAGKRSSGCSSWACSSKPCSRSSCSRATATTEAGDAEHRASAAPRRGQLQARRHEGRGLRRGHPEDLRRAGFRQHRVLRRAEGRARTVRRGVRRRRATPTATASRTRSGRPRSPATRATSPGRSRRAPRAASPATTTACSSARSSACRIRDPETLGRVARRLCQDIGVEKHALARLPVPARPRARPDDHVRLHPPPLPQGVRPARHLVAAHVLQRRRVHGEHLDLLRRRLALAARRRSRLPVQLGRGGGQDQVLRDRDLAHPPDVAAGTGRRPPRSARRPRRTGSPPASARSAATRAGQAHQDPDEDPGAVRRRARPYGGETTCIIGAAMAMTGNFKSGQAGGRRSARARPWSSSERLLLRGRRGDGRCTGTPRPSERPTARPSPPSRATQPRCVRARGRLPGSRQLGT